MDKIALKNLDFDIYTETLNNGLNIFFIPYSNKKNYFITYATYFGSDILEYRDSYDIKQKHPLGIAHFLEHKMFETESGIDPFTYFSKSGTDSNASTSYTNTQYLCSGTKNFKNNLKYLIEFVNSPYFTKENVEKEKSIIAEEIKMYEDMPDYKLEMALRQLLYKYSPRKLDIAGSIEEINKIKKDDLYNCYNNFYVPNNMFIIVAGNFDLDEALNTIKEELEMIPSKELPEIIEKEELNEVYKKKKIINTNIEVPKIALGLKIPTKELKYEKIELDLYLNMLSNMLFGSSSLFREKVRNLKLLNDFYYEWESIKNFKTLYIMASSQDPDALLKEIIEELNNLKLEEKTFERIKKVWIANEVKMIDNMDSTVSNTFSDIIDYRRVIPNKVEIIRNMNINTLKSIVKKIDFKNISTVKMLKENKD